MTASELAEMEFSEAGWTLKLKRYVRDTAVTATVEPRPRPDRPIGSGKRCVPLTSAEGAVVSPLFGIVYMRPNPNAPDFVVPGAVVTADTTLCIVEAMKVFNEVKATRDGVVGSILVASGDEVEPGQILMTLV